MTTTSTGKLRIRSNARGTYLLHQPKQPLKGTVMFSTKVRSTRPGQGLGLILFTGGLPRQRLFRAGIDFVDHFSRRVGKPED